jgi:hypothetical protein
MKYIKKKINSEVATNEKPFEKQHIMLSDLNLWFI